MALLACSITNSTSREFVEPLARQLDLPLLQNPDTASDYQYLLIFENDMLQLLPVDKHRGGSLFVDFQSAVAEHRRHTSGIQQDIARAAGCKPGYRPSVLDATAGLGNDAFVLAGLGCHITLLESHPVVYALLEDGIKRAWQMDTEAGEIIRNYIQLLPRQDSLPYLAHIVASTTQSFDVVYLDPMFPERQKSAKVKKAMQYFHDLVGFQPGQEKQLMNLALQAAGRRVVVKRPRLAPLLDNRKPSYQLKGKTVRYDIYLTSGRE